MRSNIITRGIDNYLYLPLSVFDTKSACLFLFFVFCIACRWPIVCRSDHKTQIQLPVCFVLSKSTYESTICHSHEWRHSVPGCSFVWILRVVYIQEKHCRSYNKKNITQLCSSKIRVLFSRWWWWWCSCHSKIKSIFSRERDSGVYS